VNNLIVSTSTNEFAARQFGDNRAECVEAFASRSRDARGPIAGVLLGATFWGAILLFVGVIKF
jgi:hypothetical protein